MAAASGDLPMRHLIPLLLLCALAAPAAADGVYFTESFGGADVKGQLGTQIDSAGVFRFAGGYRRGSWAVELWGGMYVGIDTRDAAAPADACPACRLAHTGSHDVGYDDGLPSVLGGGGVDLKYVQLLASHVEVYLRGGAGFVAGDISGVEHGGRGLGMGAGMQLKGKVPALGFLFWPLFFTGWGPRVTAALWADAGYDFYRLHPSFERGPTVDAQLSRMTFGFAVGSDF
jgi:hypothetical protein